MASLSEIKAHPKMSDVHNPVVFLDISIAGEEAGRIVIELFADVAPKTAENFRQFCVGQPVVKGQPQGYKTSIFHRVIPDFMLQGGDFLLGNGQGVTSIYEGKAFDDENFTIKHNRAGLLSMANSGINKNGSQFFITCNKCDWLDGKHVVFGAVIDGMITVRRMESVPTGKNNSPQLNIQITECGQL